jgi:hypothetical protein
VEERTVADPAVVEAAVEDLGGRLVLAELAEQGPDGELTARHDHERLAAAYRAIVEAD